MAVGEYGGGSHPHAGEIERDSEVGCGAAVSPIQFAYELPYPFGLDFGRRRAVSGAGR